MGRRLFGGAKLLTAGRGGAVLTNNARIAQRMTIFRDRGNDAFALSEIQAALLLPQIAQLPKWHEQRLIAADRIEQAIANVAGIQAGLASPNVERAFYKFGFFVDISFINIVVPRNSEFIFQRVRLLLISEKKFSTEFHTPFVS